MSLLDLTNVSESSIEAGEYAVTCTDAVVNETKNKDGEYIKCTFETDKGMKLFHMFNIKNKNEKATQIGQAQLKTFMRVSGKKNPNILDTATELCGLKCTVRIKIEETDAYGAQPRITMFKGLSSAAAEDSTNTVPF
jgi:hypothetical protein